MPAWSHDDERLFAILSAQQPRPSAEAIARAMAKPLREINIKLAEKKLRQREQEARRRPGGG